MPKGRQGQTRPADAAKQIDRDANEAVPVVVVVEVDPPIDGAASLPLDAAMAIPATAAAPSRIYRTVLLPSWARFTSAGAPGASGPTSPASAADVDRAKARTEESSRIG